MKKISTVLIALILAFGAWSTGYASNYIYTPLNYPGAASTFAFGINNAGTIVGDYSDASGSHGFSLSGTTYTPLNYPGGNNTAASGINNAGTIVGYYSDASGGRSFLATPVVVSVPQPTAAPQVSMYPQLSRLLTTDSTSFIRNQGGSFSAPSQQYLTDNLNFMDKLLLKTFGGSGWKNFFASAAPTAAAFGQAMSLTSTGIALADPVSGSLSLATYVASNFAPKPWNSISDTIGLGLDYGTLVSKDVTPTGVIGVALGVNGLIYSNLAKQFAQAGNDPPDSQFNQVYQSVITNPTAFNFPGVSAKLNNSLALELSSLFNTYNYAQGMTTSMNRYGSAIQAGDAISAGLQLEAFITYLSLYDSSAIQTAGYISQLKQVLIDQGIGDAAYDRQHILDLLNQIRLNGLPQDVVNYLTSIGFTSSDLSGLTQALLAYIPPDSLMGTLYSNLSSSGDLLLAASSAPVPIPGAILLFAPGLVGLVAVRRRFKK